MSCLSYPAWNSTETSQNHTHGALLVECLSPLTRLLNRAHGSTQPTDSLLQSKRKWCRNSQNQTSSQGSSTRKGSGSPKSLKTIMVLESFSTGKTSDSGYHVPAALSDKLYGKHFIAGPHQWAANSTNYIFRLQLLSFTHILSLWANSSTDSFCHWCQSPGVRKTIRTR